MITNLILAALLLDPSGKPTPAATPAPTTGEVAAAKKVRYCVESETTGSRMARRTCMTRAEWLDRGFDPLNPPGD